MVKNAEGFVYCVSSLGITGERGIFHDKLAEFTAKVKKHTDTPRAVGFGISSAEQVRVIKNYCEGVIVGSAVVKRIGESKTLDEAVKSVKQFLGELREALDE